MTAAAVLEDTDWHQDAISTIVGIAAAQPVLSADDLALSMRKPPFPNAVGLAFSAARNLGYIEAVGYTTSLQAARKHGVIRTWKRRKVEGVAA